MVGCDSDLCLGIAVDIFWGEEDGGWKKEYAKVG